METLPRLRGQGRHRIDYRHVIDWLVRKPGAFENYRYRDDLFPTSRFRMAYDGLVEQSPSRASREYLIILQLAAQESESAVDGILRLLIAQEEPITAETVERMMRSEQGMVPATEIGITAVDLSCYDALLAEAEVLA